MTEGACCVFPLFVKPPTVSTASTASVLPTVSVVLLLDGVKSSLIRVLESEREETSGGKSLSLSLLSENIPAYASSNISIFILL